MTLVENTLFGIRDKVQLAIDRLKEFEPPDGYYLAFSGGKDSIVIYDLAKKSQVKVDNHYHFTGVDPPELVKFIKTFPDVEWHKPKKSMWQLIEEKRLPPTRQRRYCCYYLKEKVGNDSGRIVVTGVRWAESARRKKRMMVETCFKNKSKRYLHPIIDWSEEEVWEYIKQEKLKYCSLYDEGFKRLGCVMCPMSSNVKREAERWPNFARAYKRACVKCYERNRLDGKRNRLMDICKNGEDIYNWWINQRGLDDSDQTVMFE